MQKLGALQTLARYMSRFRATALRQTVSLSLTMNAFHAPPLQTWWSKTLMLRPIVSLGTFRCMDATLQQTLRHNSASHSLKAVTLATSSSVAPASVDEGISLNALRGQVRILRICCNYSKGYKLNLEQDFTVLRPVVFAQAEAAQKSIEQALQVCLVYQSLCLFFEP